MILHEKKKKTFIYIYITFHLNPNQSLRQLFNVRLSSYNY